MKSKKCDEKYYNIWKNIISLYFVILDVHDEKYYMYEMYNILWNHKMNGMEHKLKLCKIQAKWERTEK